MEGKMKALLKVESNKFSNKSNFEIFNTDQKSINSIKKGYAFSTFKSLAQEMTISLKDLAKVTGIASTTLHRRENEGKLGTRESERIYLIGSLFELAVKVLGNIENAQDWFKSPQIALNNESPLLHSETLPGADAVRDLLFAMEYGIYV
jgi:putative toxin-antitoxin system antitoxin component (TIGR02293 family)